MKSCFIIATAMSVLGDEVRVPYTSTNGAQTAEIKPKALATQTLQAKLFEPCFRCAYSPWNIPLDKDQDGQAVCPSKQCTNGFGIVYRSPHNDPPCDWNPCCNMDIHTCPDGSKVGRDDTIGCCFDCTGLGCAYGDDCRICPGDEPKRSFVDQTRRLEFSDPSPQFTLDPWAPVANPTPKPTMYDPWAPVAKPTPQPTPKPGRNPCGDESRRCPDGTLVYRSISIGCRFETCPVPTPRPTAPVCDAGVKWCPDAGQYVFRDPNNNCNWYPCPAPKTKCTLEAKDGTGLGPASWFVHNRRYAPTCDVHGKYTPMQCYRHGGCWCVDQEGTVKPNTYMSHFYMKFWHTKPKCQPVATFWN